MADTRLDPKTLPLPDFPKSGWPWDIEPCQTPQTMPDGSPWPRISIVTPSYNQGQFIEETIRSVLLQGYPNLDYIIIDGASTDVSLEIIRKYEPWLAHWVSEADDGQTYAIDKGMRTATGEIVNWLNSDDYFLPGALQAIALAFHEAHRNECVLCGDAMYVTEEGKLIRESRVVPSLDRIFPDTPPLTGGIQASWFLSKGAWNRVGGINLALNYTMDSDLYYRCSQKKLDFVSVNQFVAAYRRHDETKTLQGWKESIAYKRQFYYGRLKNLDRKSSKICRPKIQRLMFGHYLRSISNHDTALQRLQKIFLALRECPRAIQSPYQWYRLYRLFVREEV